MAISRPEAEYVLDEMAMGVAPRQISALSRIANNTGFRRSVVILLIAIGWQLTAYWMDNPLLFPSLTETIKALVDATLDGTLPARVRLSFETLLISYSCGVLVAAALTIFAVSTRVGVDALSTLTAIFNPLPSVALVPLAMLWFGVGQVSMTFVVVNSVVWVMSLSTLNGFLTVSETLRMAGQNCGLSGLSFVWHVLIPAAFPSILTGMKLGWAYSWRAMVGAELVFGATNRGGGIGWFVFENRTSLETPRVFAGLLVVIIIGVIVESLIFRAIENRTVRRWGMQR
jgi:NitT/TauT family transport system permease protein